MILFITLILDVLVGVFAASRGRNDIGYFLISLILSPVLGLIIVLCQSNLKKADAEKLRREEEERHHQETLAAIRAGKTPDADF